MIIQSSNEREARVVVRDAGVVKMMSVHCEKPGSPVTFDEVARVINYGEGLGALLDSRTNTLIRNSEGCMVVFHLSECDSYNWLISFFRGANNNPVMMDSTELAGLESWMTKSADLLKWSKCSPNDTVEGPDEVGMNFTLSLYKMALEEKKKS